jgi:rhodanese-related sulfurtransferase
MGKGRKNRKPQRGSAPAPSQPAATAPAQPRSARVAAPASLTRRIALQFAALLGLSAALGFAFNAGNPIGVRFGKASLASASATSLTNFTLSSTASGTAKAPQLAPQPTPQPIQRPIPRPPIPRLPTAAVTHVQSPPVAPLSARPATNPAPVVTTPAAQTNLNPAPTHWREAKPLVDAGKALLVDVRPAPVYDAGHIPDAISLPETSSAEVIDAFLKQVPTNLTLIVYCSSTHCSMSKRVADRLVGMHQWPSVKYMTGGYLEYQQELAKPKSPPDR